jgi:hypothetical protein
MGTLCGVLGAKRQSQHEGCENTFAVTLAANQNEK